MQRKLTAILYYLNTFCFPTDTALALHNTANFRALKFLSYLSWWTESLVWMMPPAWQPYYCYNPMAQNRRICSRECVHSNLTTEGHLLPKLTAGLPASTRGSRLTPNVCKTAPLKASMSRMKPPLVEMRMSFPSLLNFRPVHSHVRSYCILNVANGPCRQKMGNMRKTVCSYCC